MKNTITGTFTFPASEPALADHFPDSPIIPGTLIIHSFMGVVRELRPDAKLQVSKFRFRSFVTPETYEYALEAKPFGFSCTLFNTNGKAVTGRILIHQEEQSDA